MKPTDARRGYAAGHDGFCGKVPYALCAWDDGFCGKVPYALCAWDDGFCGKVAYALCAWDDVRALRLKASDSEVDLFKRWMADELNLVAQSGSSSTPGSVNRDSANTDNLSGEANPCLNVSGTK